jgi:sugar/nucleoside kinase (ribokinase family)
MKKNYSIFGIGNALMDIQCFVPDAVIKKLKLKKGTMQLVEEELSKEIINSISGYKSISLPGGSCANTMSTMAFLGANPVFIGIVSDDFYGRLYLSKITQRGVKSLIKVKDNGITGTSIVLTTEDAERTMNTHLGICRELSIEDIELDVLSESKMMHTTGYKWDTDGQKEAIEFAMKSSKEMGLEISFDIADPFCVQRNLADFKRIISDYIDVIFGNHDEMKILTGEIDPVKAGIAVRRMGAKIVLVKVGCEGSYLFYDDKVIKIDIYKADKVLDSTGCGDVYAGGFLYGYTEGYDFEKCAKIASYSASKIISVPGVQFEMLDFNEINGFIKNNIL